MAIATSLGSMPGSRRAYVRDKAVQHLIAAATHRSEQVTKEHEARWSIGGTLPSGLPDIRVRLLLTAANYFLTTALIPLESELKQHPMETEDSQYLEPLFGSIKEGLQTISDAHEREVALFQIVAAVAKHAGELGCQARGATLND